MVLNADAARATAGGESVAQGESVTSRGRVGATSQVIAAAVGRHEHIVLGTQCSTLPRQQINHRGMVGIVRTHGGGGEALSFVHGLHHGAGSAVNETPNQFNITGLGGANQGSAPAATLHQDVGALVDQVERHSAMILLGVLIGDANGEDQG